MDSIKDERMGKSSCEFVHEAVTIVSAFVLILAKRVPVQNTTKA